MAVLDHPVHVKTKFSANYKYGCNGRKPFKVGYYAPDRQYRPDGTFVVTQRFIKHDLSETCRSFYLWDSVHCEGCKAPKDTEYANQMKSL